jgi:hypothetical protein
MNSVEDEHEVMTEGSPGNGISVFWIHDTLTRHDC